MSYPTEEEELREHAAAFARRVEQHFELPLWLVWLLVVINVIAVWLALR